MPFFMPRDSFVDSETGLVVNPELGVVYTDSHPLVRRYPGLFMPIDVRGEPSRVVEAATQAPGELRRGPGRPRNDR